VHVELVSWDARKQEIVEDGDHLRSGGVEIVGTALPSACGEPNLAAGKQYTDRAEMVTDSSSSHCRSFPKNGEGDVVTHW